MSLQQVFYSMALAALAVCGMEAATPPPARTEGGWAGLHEKAKKARGHDDGPAVRELTDAVLHLSVLGPAVAASVSDRLFRGERAHRQKHHPPLGERDIVDAINALAAYPQVPDYVRTSPVQVHLFRQSMSARYPDLLSADGPLSPAESVFLVDVLARQKMTNPWARVSPEAWEADTAARKAGRAPHAPLPPTINMAIPRDVAALMRGLQEGAGDESGLVVWAVHSFLDRLGVQR